MKKKVIISSILTIALCLSLIAGSTFALFTSESEVNVAVTAGKVDVVATAEDVQITSTLGNNLTETKAYIDGNVVTLDKIVPGDTVTFKIRVKNNSDVTANFRTIIKMVTDNGLWDGLNVTIDGESYDGLTKITNWAIIAPNSNDIVIPVEISLPENAGNEYQGKTCTFAYTVEAIQGNATVTDPDADTVYLYTANDLIAFATNVAHGTNYEGKTVLLMNDIDLAGKAFNGIGVDNIDRFGGLTFTGTFDGQNHKILNMNVVSNHANTAAAGFFTSAGPNAKIMNLTVENAAVSSSHYAGAIVGYLHTNGQTATIENCHVVNSTVISTPEKIGSDFDNGDKAGGIVGVAAGVDIKNCSVKDTNIGAYRDFGGIVGSANTVNVQGCTVENITLAINVAHNYKNYTTDEEHNAGAIIGKTNENVTASGCTETNVNTTKAALVATAADLKSAIENGGNVVITKDIVIDETWAGPANLYTPYNAVTVVIDGENHKITGLTAPLIEDVSFSDVTIKNLTLDNSKVTAVIGNFKGLANLVANGDLAEVNLENCKVVNSSVKTTEDVRAAALVGWMDGELTVNNCKVDDCEISVFGSVAGVIGHFEGNTEAANTVNVSNTIVSNSNFNSIDTGAWRVGTIIGTANNGVTVNVNNCTSVNNAVSQINKVNPEHEIYGRLSAAELGNSILFADDTVYCSAEYLRNILTASASVTLEKNYVVIDSWTPIEGKNLTIDGNGYSIGGLTAALVNVSNKNVEISNITFENCNINSGSKTNGMGDAVVVGYVQNLGTVKLDNVTVKNSKVDNSADVSGAVLVGYSSSVDTISINNCTIENVSVKAGSNAAGILGYVQQSTVVVTNSRITGLTLKGEKAEKEGAYVGTITEDAVVTVTGSEANIAKKYGRILLNGQFNG